MTTYFEDVAVGEAVDCGTCDVTEAELLEFAEAYDPQPIHVDPDAAADSIHGGLIASGWHTAAMCMRRLVEGFLADAAVMGSPGVDELRWPAPVRPGDTLSVELAVVGKRPSGSHDDRGVVRAEVTAENGDGETVLSMTPAMLFARR